MLTIYGKIIFIKFLRLGKDISTPVPLNKDNQWQI